MNDNGQCVVVWEERNLLSRLKVLERGRSQRGNEKEWKHDRRGGKMAETRDVEL